ncbi:MAG: B12-binding domain-containing radical SAM protein [Candidatus Aminicenantes bacterium]
MEKILLINPNQIYYTKTYRESAQGSIGLPLGLLYVASVLEKKGCHVQVVDSLATEHTTMQRFRDHVEYGIPSEVLGRIIEESKPHLVGISSQFATQEESVFRTAKLVKTISDSIPVVVGGANVSCRSRELLRNEHIDIAVKSEGETVIQEIIDFYRGSKELGSIKGIAFREGDCIEESDGRLPIKNMDEIPFPAYHLVDMEKYLTLYKKGIYTRDRDVKRNISMITSRGCPYHCVFCSIGQTMGRAWRAHSPGYVIRHVQKLVETYNIRHLHFEDDNLLLDPDRFLPILDALAREKVTWDTPNGIRVNLALHENMLRKMTQAGCKSLTIGVESGDQSILNDVVKKRLKLDQVEEFARRCKKVKLPLRAFFVLGFPGETMETMQKTADFALHLLEAYDVETINLIATPLYGTELYEICDKNHYFSKEITPRTLSESTVSDGRGLINTESFSAQDVERMSQDLTARVYRRLLWKGIAHPIKSLKRVGNLYILKRTLKRMARSR